MSDAILSATSSSATSAPNARKLRGVFLNAPEANCSIYESGKMAFQSLIISDRYQLDYQEIDVNSREVSRDYDFYIFNYHYVVMGWLDTRCLRELPGVTAALILEILPNDPFVLCPKDFDVYLPLDPTTKIADKRVYAMPRPLEVPAALTPYKESAIPVIGSFGLGTPGKGFELVVDAVNKEFDEAIVRINIPPGTHVEGATVKLQGRDYPGYLTELCQRVAKPGVQVIVTREYMTKEGLIDWCGQNTLNCFLYNRDQSGLAATTDQAISSGRPLAVSTNETFRHIHPYLKPYPFQSLKESIALSVPRVLEMQRDWAPRNFAKKFEEALAVFGPRSEHAKEKSAQVDSQPFVLRAFASPAPANSSSVNSSPERLSVRIRSKLKIRTRAKQLLGMAEPIPEAPPALHTGDYLEGEESARNVGTAPSDQLDVVQSRPASITIGTTREARENTILIVNHREEHCGIHQYGVNISEALQKSSRYAFAYAECSSAEELHQAVLRTNPSAIIYNYHSPTMPWLSSETTRRYKVPQLGMMHEVTQEEADKATQELFSYHLCPDPTLIENQPYVFKTRRLIPPYLNYKFVPEVVTIGTFGFGSGDKGFERVIHTVQHEFDEARIVMNIPFNDFVPKNIQEDVIERVEFSRQRLVKPGIEVVVTHDFLSRRQLLDFLASNTLNAFFYNPGKDLGISSTIEHALAVQRPIAITKCEMFRHVTSISPSICIEDASLKQIIENGVAPLVPFYNEWSEPNFILDYERILDRVLGKERGSERQTQTLETAATAANKSNGMLFNRILDNTARIQYRPVIDKLFELHPEMMSRKIQEANVQQAFVMDTVQKFAAKFTKPKILCAGSYEDTAAAGLKSLGYQIEEIDPAVNRDLDTYFQDPSTIKGTYDIIFSTSVLEHVPDDELFMSQIAELLAPGGTAILTCDYNDQYRPGDPIPREDLRFYTQRDLKERILPILKGCSLVDDPQWDCAEPDFAYAGIYRYTFATLVFQKYGQQSD
jgi:SAM-dependent methyltransferase